MVGAEGPRHSTTVGSDGEAVPDAESSGLRAIAVWGVQSAVCGLGFEEPRSNPEPQALNPKP